MFGLFFDSPQSVWELTYLLDYHALNARFLSFQAVVYMNIRVMKEGLNYEVLEQEMLGQDAVDKQYSTMDEEDEKGSADGAFAY